MTTEARLLLQQAMTDVLRHSLPSSVPVNQLAAVVVEQMCRQMGGEAWYIPAPDRAPRDAAIRRDFNGRNRDALCRQYGLSRSRFYEIIQTRNPR
ncbi:Mor transcription activator family protein [Parachitinimonas caeni]|uniref:Mor transcription activator family protein n=1 Tax=Parachitinimonas caeni TaxID=3031301 RepID=A0ABT7DVS4_9NEIS|nr:Mor transcription activator family protein [Parachitinimonas caeni]MDK2124159.1 Mor transcription activator family protein [Parachitinimonas caeni]